MIRSHSLLLACLSLGLGCASSSKGSDNPDAGQYDGYYSENGDTAGGTDQGNTTSPTGPRPKARASTGTRGGAKAKGKSIALVPTKPPVSGDKPQVTRPTRPEFAVDGVFPTSAAVGSLIEVYGSGFPEDAKAVKVFVGGKALEIVEVTPDRVVAKVGAVSSGVVEVGKGTGRIGRGTRIKTQGTFTATAADGAFNQPRTVVGHGLLGKVYEAPADAAEVPNFNDLGNPVALVAVDDLDIPAGAAPAGVAGRSQSFGIHFQGSLNIVEAGEYELCLTAGDGALLFLDQTPVIDNDGAGAAREVCETLFIEPGEYGLDLLYYQGADTEAGLSLTWAKDGGAKEPIPATAFFPPEGLYDLAVAVDQAG
ncbi:PA14 domain-containing protein [Paraliomyxa miuraensis]|uniref:PA14 domain-containing protein n=1 Tax=Paraliomyxa miuraensis TaxID=376150 RepID=UPI002254006E|nr:PA14 domain-containing protein [Paraliomyxa miuraensis]MCX4239345.1 PA14 domain-containing protein [Paraliomyxa miuraensis]